MTKIRDVIKDKGPEFIAVDSSSFVDLAITKMVDRNIGAILVMEEGNLIGMFTERDVLKCWVNTHESFDKVKIKDVMSKDIMIVQPEDDLNYAMTIMINKKIRHLPVVDNGRVTSVISIRDMVKAQVTNLQAEVHYLRDYITGG
jgi:signal-transduction protein with cAMP-binding, CBS, and nucleotidyltransferase domain